TILGDYKNVNGWYLPFSVESGVKGNPNRQKVTYSKIEANVTMAASLFRRPGIKSATPEELQGQPADASETLPKVAGQTAAPETLHPPKAVEAVAATTGGSTSATTAPAPPLTPVTIDSETISGLGARNIGSAATSRRI